MKWKFIHSELIRDFKVPAEVTTEEKLELWKSTYLTPYKYEEGVSEALKKIEQDLKEEKNFVIPTDFKVPSNIRPEKVNAYLSENWVYQWTINFSDKQPFICVIILSTKPVY